MTFSSIIPVFQIFNEDLAKEFYCNFLGFHIDWEHRFDEGLPLYLQVTIGSVHLHLTEHHGDCTPGSKCRIYVDDAEELQKELVSKNYKSCEPELAIMEWGKDLFVLDPFGNKIIFTQPV